MKTNVSFRVEFDDAGFYHIVARIEDPSAKGPIEIKGPPTHYAGVARFQYHDEYYVAFSNYWEGAVPQTETVFRLEAVR